MKDKKFNIEEAYQHYLRHLGLSDLDPNSTQFTEMRKAFYGGVTEMLVYCEQVEGPIDIYKIRQDCVAFWLKETKEAQARTENRASN